MANEKKPAADSEGKETSKKVAGAASQKLKDQSSDASEKSLSGSALSQSGTDKETSPDVASMASKTLLDPDSSKNARSIAGSDLSQASGQNKKK